ncbi:IclR family transcriptional regulator [Deinococcus sp. UYEF24]
MTLSGLERTGQVLRRFTDTVPEWGVTEMALELGMSKAGMHHVLSTLSQIGLLHRTPAGRYRLGFMLLVYHTALMAHSPWREVGHWELQHLATRLAEPVHLMAFDGGNIICIDLVQGGPLPSLVHVGEVLPPYASASGKAIMAYRPAAEIDHVCLEMSARTPNTIVSHDELQSELARVRENGYAVDIEELNLGRCGIAAPIRNHDGEIVAAITIAAVSAHFQRNRAVWLTELQDATRRASERLGYFC